MMLLNKIKLKPVCIRSCSFKYTDCRNFSQYLHLKRFSPLSFPNFVIQSKLIAIALAKNDCANSFFIVNWGYKAREVGCIVYRAAPRSLFQISMVKKGIENDRN